MALQCPKCNQEIKTENINVAENTLFCVACAEAFKLSKLTQKSTPKDEEMTAELRTILESNNLAEYIAVFEQHKIFDADILSELNEAELEKIGINALGDRKKILKLFEQKTDTPLQSPNVANETNPTKIVMHHAAQSGDDVQTGFGRGFGETIGEKTGGCVWSIGGLVIIGIIIAIVIQGC